MPSLFVNYLLLWTHQPWVWQTQGFSHLEARRMCSPCLRWPLTMKITHWLCPKRFAFPSQRATKPILYQPCGEKKVGSPASRERPVSSQHSGIIRHSHCSSWCDKPASTAPTKACRCHDDPHSTWKAPVCPCFSDALLSPARRLCSNCVLFLPLLHAANPGDEQFRGVWVWWSWP